MKLFAVFFVLFLAAAEAEAARYLRDGRVAQPNYIRYNRWGLNPLLQSNYAAVPYGTAIHHSPFGTSVWQSHGIYHRYGIKVGEVRSMYDNFVYPSPCGGRGRYSEIYHRR